MAARLPLHSSAGTAAPLPPGASQGDSEDSPRRRRPWRDKFKFAFRGLKLGVRGHSSFSVHFFFTALVLAAAGILQCELWEWCVLLGCIGLVLTAELLNSALETLFRGLDDETKARVWPSLDIAAGAVLMASIASAVIGCLVFGRHLLQFLWPLTH
jgi:diacylglycerol kinase